MDLTSSSHSPVFTHKLFPQKKQIARGAKGGVYKWFNPDRKQNVILKHFPNKNIDDDKIIHEIHMNKYMFDSKRFPTFYGAFYNDEGVYLEQELIPGISLFMMQKECGNAPMSETHTMRMFLDMCEFIKDCHSSGIIHRDIKLDNFVYSNIDNCVYGIDLGLSKRIVNTEDIPIDSKTGNLALYNKVNLGCVGTVMYMSPEMFLKGPYTAKTDIWSLGVCLYELLHSRNPFHTIDNWDSTHNGKLSQTSLNKGYERCMSTGLIFDEQLSNNTKDILMEMLHPVDTMRPTIFELEDYLKK